MVRLCLMPILSVKFLGRLQGNLVMRGWVKSCHMNLIFV